MSNGIIAIDSQLLAGLPDVPATLEEAQLETLPGNMPELDLVVYRARARYGRFSGPDMAGAMMSDCLLDAAFLEVAKRKLVENLMKSKDPRQDVASAAGLKDLVNASVGVRLAQMKAAEVMAMKNKGERRKSQAPQGIIGTSISADNVQVNITPQNPPAVVVG